MFLLGTVVNVVTVVAGTLIGLSFQRISEQQKESLLSVMSIVVITIGMGMALEMKDALVSIFCLAGGVLLGEWWNWEERLQKMGDRLQHRFGKGEEGTVAEAFVTTTLIFCVGAMAIIGAMNSGLQNDHRVLLTKSFIDGFCAIIFTTTLGFGVIFSAIPVFIYQGSIAFLFFLLGTYLPQELVTDLVNLITGVGGVLIIAIGLNVLGLTRIRLGNLLPSLLLVFVAAIIRYIM